MSSLRMRIAGQMPTSVQNSAEGDHAAGRATAGRAWSSDQGAEAAEEAVDGAAGGVAVDGQAAGVARQVDPAADAWLTGLGPISRRTAGA